MQKNLNIEKIIFKIDQIKFLAIHITNQKLGIIWHKIKIYNFDSYNVFLLIATNIAVLLMTAFSAPGPHINNQCVCF